MLATPLPDFLIYLAAAVTVVTLFRLLRLSPVLGYLAAGALIGASGLNLARDAESAHSIAEFGIVFLMFMIGLELSWDRLKAMRTEVFWLGTLQVFITTIVFAKVALVLGIDPTAALIIGCGLSLSSTALVLQVLESRGELTGQSGRLALAILILQDLVVLPILVLLPIIASNEGSFSDEIALAGLRAFAALAGIVLVGRLLLRPLFRIIARLRSEELFMATILLVVLGIAWVTETAGLSTALGAFVAGLLVAETEFQHQVEVDVKPFKSLLMGLFFMTIGMRIDLQFLHENALEVVLWALGILSIKGTVLFVLLRQQRYPKQVSLRVALVMAQGGEFGFILFALAAQLGLIGEQMAGNLLVAVTVSMAVTPLLDSLSGVLERRQWNRLRHDPELLTQENRDISGHVVVIGYGSMGQFLAHFLAQEKIPFAVLDVDPRAVAQGRRHHMPVYFGDGARAEVLEAIGVQRARAIILTLHDATELKTVFLSLRAGQPDLPILLRTSDFSNEQHYKKLGATLAVPELQVSCMRLIAGLLAQMGHPEADIKRVMQRLRDEPSPAPAPRI